MLVISIYVEYEDTALGGGHYLDDLITVQKIMFSILEWVFKQSIYIDRT
jgi:hypothetical protein